MKAHKIRLARVCAAALLAAGIVTLAPVEADGAAASYFGWVTNSKDGTVSVIDLDTYTVLATHNVGKKPLGVTGLEGSMVLVAVQGTNQVVIVDAANGVVEALDVGRGPQDIALSRKSEFAYVSLLKEGMIQLISEAGSGTKVEVGKRPGSMDYSANSKWVAVVNGGDGTLDIFRAKDLPTARQPRTTLVIGNKPATVAFHRKSKELAVTSPKAGTVTVVDVKKGTIAETVTLPGGPWGIAYSPKSNNKAAVTLSRAGAVVLFTNETGVDIDVGRKPKGVVFTPDGKRILVANSGSGTVSVVDVATETVVATVDVGRSPFAVAVTAQ